MKTVLITGAAGFIGSHLCDYYLSINFRVIGIDNFLTGNINNINHIIKNDNFKFIEADVCDSFSINDEIDYILHFASTASPIDYLKYPIETLQIGSIGTENILKLAETKNSIVLVASTSEVYGDPLEHPQSESYYGNVNPIGPRGVYDEAKRYLEAMTIAYKNNRNLSIRIVRIFNTYGPRMRVNDGRAIPNFINQALKNDNFTIYGDGHQTRSFCYIDDTISGIDAVLNSNYELPINIGNDNELSIMDLVQIIQSIIPSKSKIIFEKLPKNDPKLRRPDISLANKILNWNPKTSILEGIEKTTEYYKKLYNFKI